MTRPRALRRTIGLGLVCAGVVATAAGSLGGSSDAAPHARPHAHAHAIHDYVALGDSYTAGSGIPPVPTTGCQRSTRGYPSVLTRRLDLTADDASCGGALTPSADSPQSFPDGSPPNPPQLTDVGPGTDLVTISLGINDADFADVISQCVTLAPLLPGGNPCETSFQDPLHGDTIAPRIAAMQGSLSAVIAEAQRRAPHARVVVVGYPQLVPPSGTCAALPFATGDYAYVRRFFVEVDAAERAAAQAEGATYVDLLAASVGHSACAGSNAWVNGASSTSRAMAFHPFANEERVVASLVVQAVD